MKVVTYQIGVDVLGFPIYCEHRLYEGSYNENKFNSKPKKWFRVIQKIIKQH